MVNKNRWLIDFRDKLYKSQNGKCIYCGVKLKNETMQLDHVIPRIKNGNTRVDNLALACPRCNASKNGKSLDEWLVMCHGKKIEAHKEYRYRMEITKRIPLIKLGIDHEKNMD